VTLTDDPAWEGLLRGIAAASVPSGELPGQPPLPVGHTLGRFELRALLGAGGFGVVYRAHDTVLGRDVALKLPWRRGATAARGFLSEARTVAALNDPHLVSVYDVGEVDGFPFIALELVQGRSLRARLASGPMPVDEARPILLGVARALCAVHARGWVHLDVKPDNVIVTEDGSVKLLDFGLAHPTGQASNVGGTPSYAPPEATSLTPRDARFDTFSFGVLGQELLLCVRAPRPAVELSRAGTLGALVRQCLSENPDERPASGQVLVRALERRSQPGRWLAAAGLVLTLAAAVWLAQRERPAPPPQQHVRLTAQRVDRPIHAAALARNGRGVLSADSRGLWRFDVEAPTRLSAVMLPEPGEVGTVRSRSDGRWLVSTHDGGTVLWLVEAEGQKATEAHRGAFRMGDVGPDGTVLELDDTKLTVRRAGGELVRATGEKEVLLYASFSDDGQLVLIASQRLQQLGWLRCLEVASTTDLEVRWAYCAEALTQPWMPVVAAWHPEGVAWVETEAAGAGSGVAIHLQPLSEGRPSGARRRLDGIEEETVSGLSVGRAGELLTLRHEVRRTTELFVGASLQPASVEDFDERPTAWADDGTLWRTQSRARVPTVIATRSDAGLVQLPLDGWLSAATPVDGDVLVWTSKGTLDGGSSRWDLVRLLADGGLEPSLLPGVVEETVSLSRHLPPRAQVSCAHEHEPCVLGWPGAPYEFYALERRAPPRLLFSVPDLRERYGKWKLTARSTLLLADGSGALRELDLSGRELARWEVGAFEALLALGTRGDDVLVSGPVRAHGRYHLVQLEADGGRAVLFDDALKAITDLVNGPDGGLAVGVRLIDTDLWLSRSAAH
jgi:hypothetical protein